MSPCGPRPPKGGLGKRSPGALQRRKLAENRSPAAGKSKEPSELVEQRVIVGSTGASDDQGRTCRASDLIGFVSAEEDVSSERSPQPGEQSGGATSAQPRSRRRGGGFVYDSRRKRVVMGRRWPNGSWMQGKRRSQPSRLRRRFNPLAEGSGTPARKRPRLRVATPRGDGENRANSPQPRRFLPAGRLRSSGSRAAGDCIRGWPDCA
jgi:hypothetical protein